MKSGVHPTTIGTPCAKVSRILGQCTIRLANTKMTEHGKPDEVQSQQQPQNKLSNQLIGLFSLVHHIRRVDG